MKVIVIVMVMVKGDGDDDGEGDDDSDGDDVEQTPRTNRLHNKSNTTESAHNMLTTAIQA